MASRESRPVTAAAFQSRRVPLRLPVHLRQDARQWYGVAAVVNRGGALLLSPIACEPESILTVMNTESGQSARCRVVWCGEDPQDGHRIGIAFVESQPSFWGSSYENLAGTAPSATDAS